MGIVTRFPPSPTGHLHLGGARTAIINWLFAKQNNGKFVVRMEDTDMRRSSRQYESSILSSLKWMGLDFDDTVIRQSERGETYKKVINQLLDADKAYRCICTPERIEKLRAQQQKKGLKPKYDRRCRSKGVPVDTDLSFVVRLKSPENGVVRFKDFIQGNVEFQNSELDDLIIARSDGTPTYHLTSVVDDIDAKISHIIRGDDHLNNTPRQIHIYDALNLTPPIYGHIPLLHSNDGKKLSKRSGLGDIKSFEAIGILPKALVNYLVNIGWSGSDGEEVRNIEEIYSDFDLKSISKSSARFDQKKLYWFNQKYMVASPPSSLVEIFKTFIDKSDSFESSLLEEVISLYAERANTIKDMAEKSFFFFQKPTVFNAKAKEKFIDLRAIELISTTISRLRIMEEWDSESIRRELKRIVEENSIGFSALGQPIRIALSGSTNSPDIAEILNILGREESLARMEFAVKNLKTWLQFKA
ncbi:MAG: glutamate--tRNA ligase [Pseudomonadota bacterium]|nr:glutamate--tRNA ligase [Pseudomonadota bacterium]